MNEVSLAFNLPDCLVKHREAFVELPDRHKALNKRKLEPRIEYPVTHGLKLLQTALQNLNPSRRVAAVNGQRTFIAACGSKIRPQGMRFGVRE